MPPVKEAELTITVRLHVSEVQGLREALALINAAPGANIYSIDAKLSRALDSWISKNGPRANEVT